MKAQAQAPTPRPRGRVRVQFGPPSARPTVVPEPPPVRVPVDVAKGAKPPRERKKADPRLVAAARELRDRWLERVNEEGVEVPEGKYDVSRMIAGAAGPARVTPVPHPQRLLPDAA